jgi:hypothetical protein
MYGSKRSLLQKIRSLIKNVIALNGKVEQLDAMAIKLSVLETQFGSNIQGSAYWLNDAVTLNDQDRRKEVFSEIISALKPDGIIETGTNLGFSTGYFAAKTGLPVFSCEIDPMRFNLSKKLLMPYFNSIQLYNNNSVNFLKEFPADPKSVYFFYLDAHWYDFLPLKQEIEIISARWEEFVIMVDDFKVEGDSGYGYDDYGSVGTLTLEYIRNLVKRLSLEVYFPTFPSSQETGFKRGYIILSRGGINSGLNKLPSIKRHNQ